MPYVNPATGFTPLASLPAAAQAALRDEQMQEQQMQAPVHAQQQQQQQPVPTPALTAAPLPPCCNSADAYQADCRVCDGTPARETSSAGGSLSDQLQQMVAVTARQADQGTAATPGALSKLQAMMKMELKIQQLESMRRKKTPAPTTPPPVPATASGAAFLAILKMEQMQAKITALESAQQHSP
jgi:hypothetical protein